MRIVKHPFWHMLITASHFVGKQMPVKKGLRVVVHQQQDDGTTRVIANASRTLSKSEKNYDAHKLGVLALKWAITDRFHEYFMEGILGCSLTTILSPIF